MQAPRCKRVLIVDDNPQFLDAARVLLEERGFEVRLARDGNEGLAMAERESPDLIVLDLMMPGRSGFGVIDRLRRRSDLGPRILVVTANEEERHSKIALSKGADRYLRKPFEMSELLAAVDALVGPPG
jgi:DNA-binding response OmpR family regulator